MNLLLIGVNHKTAPLAVREKLSFSRDEKRELMYRFKSKGYIDEVFLLSTCNRLELYLITEKKDVARSLALNKLEDYSGLPEKELCSCIYTYKDMTAANHFYRVAAGLDSLVIGESQILGQIKKSFALAQDMEMIDTYLHRLCTEVIRVGKRVRHETAINENAASVSYVAVELARDIFGSLAGEKVMILGAGETSELTLKNLVDYGVEGVLVANRTYENGRKLADEYNGEVIHWDKLSEFVGEVDIIIGSTAAPHSVLHRENLENALKNKRGPMFLIDIAVPRDIDPGVETLPGVHLYDLDDLESVVEENIVSRKEEIKNTEEIIYMEIEEFKKWIQERKCVPLIKEMRKKADKVKEKEVNRAIHQLQESEETPQEIVHKMAHRLVNKLLHHPTVGVKEIATENKGEQKIDLIREVLTN